MAVRQRSDVGRGAATGFYFAPGYQVNREKMTARERPGESRAAGRMGALAGRRVEPGQKTGRGHRVFVSIGDLQNGESQAPAIKSF